ncbi:MAG TPA: choice-of-anchor P family protein [Burkholderiales bacterium]|nr:choice-of-anchor P family protein [Burkholderiales bacterium]
MRSTATFRRRAVGLAGLAAGLMVLGTGEAQLGLPSLPLPPLPLPLPGDDPADGEATGGASGVTAVILGNVTSLASTGTLSSPSEPLGIGLSTADIFGLGSAEALHAATMGWTDQVVSETSMGNLVVTVAGTGISADLILSRAKAVSGAGTTGLSSIEGLSIAGSPITPTGAPNEVIWLPGLTVTLNEQIQSAGGIVVNALHVRTLDGLIDVVIGSAQAGI